MTLSTKSPAPVAAEIGALEAVRAGNSNDFDGTTALARLQASHLMRGLALLPDTAAALSLLVFGEVRT